MVKAQYARAFRPPTLTEQAFGDPDIQPVTSETAELGYIQKFPRGEWRATAAYTELEDIIIFDPTGFNPVTRPYFHINARSAQLRSVELEGERQLESDLGLFGSLTVTDTELSGPADDIPGASDWLLQLGADYHVSADSTLSLTHREVSGFARQAADPRGVADGFGVTNVAWTADWRDGTTLRAGVSNLFDVDVAYPAFLGSDRDFQPIVSYPEDLPYGPRTWWLELDHTF